MATKRLSIASCEVVSADFLPLAGKILAVVRELKPDPELAKNIRQASRKHRRNFKIRRFDIK